MNRGVVAVGLAVLFISGLIPSISNAAEATAPQGKWVVDDTGKAVFVTDKPQVLTSPAPVPTQADAPAVKERRSFGLGYFTTSAPLGFRWWATEGFGLDLGLGFNILGGGGGSTSNRIAAEVGLLPALAQRNNLTFFLRVGAGLELGQHGISTLDTSSISPTAGGSNADLTINVNMIAGAEYLLTGIGLPNVAFTGGIGAGVQITKPDGADIQYAIGTASYTGGLMEAVVLGVHFYL